MSSPGGCSRLADHQEWCLCWWAEFLPAAKWPGLEEPPASTPWTGSERQRMRVTHTHTHPSSPVQELTHTCCVQQQQDSCLPSIFIKYPPSTKLLVEENDSSPTVNLRYKQQSKIRQLALGEEAELVETILKKPKSLIL